MCVREDVASQSHNEFVISFFSSCQQSERWKMRKGKGVERYLTTRELSGKDRQTDK